MNTETENKMIKKQQFITLPVSDKKLFNRCISSDKYLLLFEYADKVFEGWEFYENDIYENLFI